MSQTINLNSTPNITNTDYLAIQRGPNQSYKIQISQLLSLAQPPISLSTQTIMGRYSQGLGSYQPISISGDFKLDSTNGVLALTNPTVPIPPNTFLGNVAPGSSLPTPVSLQTIAQQSFLSLNAASSGQINSNSKIIGLSADGTAAVLISPSQLLSTQSSALGEIITNVFTGDGTTTTFTLSLKPGANSASLVFIGGSFYDSANYTISGTQIIFKKAPPRTADIQVLIIIPTTSSGMLTTNPAGYQVFAVADNNGYTCFEIGLNGAIKPVAIQFGYLDTSSTIPILNSTGTVLGYFDNQGNVNFIGSATFGNNQITISANTQQGFQIQDVDGFIGLQLTNTGLLINTLSVSTIITPFTAPSGTKIGNLTILTSGVYDYAIQDPNGFLLEYVYQGVYYGPNSLADAPNLNDIIPERNARALALSAAIIGQTDSTAARPVYNYNHILMYGQSLSSGWEGWPALSTTPFLDTLMWGGSVRPQNEDATTFTPFIDSNFHALIATNDANTTTGGTLGQQFTPSQVAAFLPNNYTLGECSIVAGVNFFRQLQLQSLQLASNPNSLIVANSCGVGSINIANLLPTATVNLFNRLITCVEGAKAAAVALGQTYGVTAIWHMQGEEDYALGTTASSFQSLTQTFYADFNSQITTSILNQAANPAIFTYQTGGIFTNDSLGLAVANAQLASALTQPNWYMVGPNYPYTDKGGHLDANGYRWMGLKFGQITHKVLVLGQKWLPVYPIQITYYSSAQGGPCILVDYHVPCPPLVFDVCYSGSESETAAMTVNNYADKGFTVLDGGTTVVTLSSVVLAADAVIQINLPSNLINPTTSVLRYADETYHLGNGNVRDSDPMIANSDYTYTAGSGQFQGDNIPALNNLPYTMYNWSVAFSQTIIPATN